LTVMMFRAVGVVLFETLLARKVDIAILAQPVTVRVLHVLLVSPIMHKISVTTIAVSHPGECAVRRVVVGLARSYR
jgi:hypothetical protein